MRPILLLILICVFGSVSGQHYLDSTAQWYLDGASGNVSPGAEYSIYHATQYFEGDTSITGLNYYKLYQDYSNTTWPGNGPPSTYTLTHQFLLALREDSGIFYTYKDSDYAIANFNLNLHDTLPALTSCSGYHQGTVIKVDSFYLGSELRRRFFWIDSANYYLSGILLEGIGGDPGLAGPCIFDHCFEGCTSLTYFCQDGHSISYPNLDTSSCTLLYNNIPSVENRKALKIFPNPAEDYLHIESDCENCTAQLYTSSGQKIFTYELKFSKRASLEVKFLEPGVYIINVKDVNSGFQRSLLVIKPD